MNDFDWVKEVEPMEPEMEYLKDNFDNLKPIIKGDKTYYIDSKQKPVFFYYQDNSISDIYFDYLRIWDYLMDNFNINHQKIRELIGVWVKDTYNIYGLIPEPYRVKAF
jgi:hypothetical protein